MRGAWLIALAVLARPAAADVIVIDLGSDDTLSVPVAPGPLRVLIRNRLVHMNYDVVVRREVIPIDAFPLQEKASTAGGGCEALVSLVAEIDKAPDEKRVAEVTGQIRAQMGNANCTPEQLKVINDGLARTESEVGTYPVSAGEQLTIVVTRGDGKKKWTRVASAGARGAWLTSYGAATVPDRDEKFFLRAKDGGKFEVTPEQDRGDSLKVIPTVFFTWLPASRQLKDWSWGPTAGLGVKSDRPTVFAGWTFTYNWNLGFTVGGGLVSETRLSGRYTADPPQELSELVADDQLHMRVYRVRWMAAVTFRFGSNPFVAATPAAPAEKKPDKK